MAVMSSFLLHGCIKLLYCIPVPGWECWDIVISVILVRLKGGQDCKIKNSVSISVNEPGAEQNSYYETEKERRLGDPRKQLVKSVRVSDRER